MPTREQRGFHSMVCAKVKNNSNVMLCMTDRRKCDYTEAHAKLFVQADGKDISMLTRNMPTLGGQKTNTQLFRVLYSTQHRLHRCWSIFHAASSHKAASILGCTSVAPACRNCQKSCHNISNTTAQEKEQKAKGLTLREGKSAMLLLLVTRLIHTFNFNLAAWYHCA